MQKTNFLLGKEQNFKVVARLVTRNHYYLYDEVSGQSFYCFYNELDDTWRSRDEMETIKDDNGDNIEVHKKITNQQVLQLLNQQYHIDHNEHFYEDDNDNEDDDEYEYEHDDNFGF